MGFISAIIDVMGDTLTMALFIRRRLVTITIHMFIVFAIIDD